MRGIILIVFLTGCAQTAQVPTHRWVSDSATRADYGRDHTTCELSQETFREYKGCMEDKGYILEAF